MGQDDAAKSLMAREILQIPGLADGLIAQLTEVRDIANRIRAYAPHRVVFCARGSSGHVGVYLRYLFEANLALPGAMAAPSIFTAYRQRFDMRGTLFVLISQSGQSPDLIETTNSVRDGGAFALGIVNHQHSPAAQACDLVLPVQAGAERAVAATKTVTQSMIAGAMLVSELARDHELSAGLARLPERLSRALDCDWSPWGAHLTQACAAFVVARGYGLGSAQEIALKLMEAVRLPAFGYSAAELRHGPRAVVGPGTPALVLRQKDETAAGIDELVRDLRETDTSVFSAGGVHATLPWIGDDHPVCDPIAMLAPAYAAIEAAARQRGNDPDVPPHLSKVTLTT